MIKSRHISLLLILAVSIPLSISAYAQNLPLGVLPTPSPDKSPLELSIDKNTYKPGDRIQIKIEAKQNGYLYLYDIDPAGSITLLYPNAYQPDPKVLPGTIQLPGKGYHFTIGYPEGIETLVAILAQAPIEQLAAPSDTTYRPLEMEPQALVNDLSIELTETGWSSAWVQFSIYQPKGIVHIKSYPPGAKIRVNGEDRGLAPKDLILPAGENEIALLKSGYQSFTQTITVKDQDMIDIEARLERALPPSGTYYTGSVPVFFGIDAGADSVGMEIGSLGAFGLAVAIRFTEQATAEPGEKYNIGPELDLDLRVRFELNESLRVVMGAGGGFQDTAIAPSVPSSILPQAIDIEPDIETEFSPSFTIGLEIGLGHASLMGAYHLRRGFIVGVGIGF